MLTLQSAAGGWTALRVRRCLATLTAAITLVAPRSAVSQAVGALTLEDAHKAARAASPELRAATEAVAAAVARERQAGAHVNPTFAYGREQTSRQGQTNAQNVAQFEQPLEIGGQRAARREAARLRRESAETRLASAISQLDFEVARSFVVAVAADQRAHLAEQTADAFTEARRVSDQRLAAGDVSGYVARRLRLEAARFAALRASVDLERRTARSALAMLIGRSSVEGASLILRSELSDSASALLALPVDTLQALASRLRPDLRLASLDAEVALADARVTARERVPTPTLSAGYKDERVAAPSGGSLSGFRGVIAGLSIPLPVFDRRAAAVEASDADARRLRAEEDVVRRRVAREVLDARDALRAAEEQRAALAPYVGEDSRVAVRAVQASYAEGEITLVEWLDAIRAYQDAESTYVTLQAEVAIRRAALSRAVGTPLFPIDSTHR